jgi:hypothetical protein
MATAASRHLESCTSTDRINAFAFESIREGFASPEIFETVGANSVYRTVCWMFLCSR